MSVHLSYHRMQYLVYKALVQILVDSEPELFSRSQEKSGREGNNQRSIVIYFREMRR